jgi:hypothetical protein
MKHIKEFELFESYYQDSLSRKMVETAKKMEARLAGDSVRINSRDVGSNEELRALRSEALDKVKGGDKRAYGAMYSKGGNCESFFIVAPDAGINALQKPITDFDLNVSYREEPGAWCVIDVYATKGSGKSLYMETEGDVLYQWDNYENRAKGSLVDKKA